jgi:pyruvate-ferredoxin/flavodoxin oxidoreductase
MGEVRYASLEKSFPAQAQELFEATQRNAAWRYEQYRRLAGGVAISKT